jgi:hypothetical protein
MPLIPDEIPQQNFEKIRDRIGLIIYQELENQWSEFGDEDLEAPLPNPDISTTPESIKVYVDRVIPIGEEECPVINVLLNGASYQVENRYRANGANTFFIDVYTKAQSEDASDWDTLANIKLQKIIGKIAFILRHSFYQTLGFAPGFIGGTNILNIQIADARDPNMNLNGCVMGRITFEVKATEDVTPVATRDMTGFYSTIKLYNTNKGFLFIDEY